MREITIQEQKELMLKMITYLSEVCRENKLSFYLEGGTLIGQIRHGGFIPWDDDFDIAMFREDYEKLCVILSETKPYKIISHRNSKNYGSFFAKLVDTRTQLISPNYHDSSDLGVFIDIFPIDKVPKNKLKKWFYFNRIWYLRKLSIFTILRDVKKSSPLFLPWLFFRNVNRDWIIEKANMIAGSYNKTNSNQITNILGSFVKYVELPIEYYEKSTNIDFENISLPAPIEYDAYLRYIYGDYMELPPEEDRVGHHEYTAYWRTDLI